MGLIPGGSEPETVGTPDRAITEAAFVDALRDRSADVEGLVRELYRARGWDVRPAEDGFVATRDGEHRRVVVRRESRLPGVDTPSLPDGTDVVVAVGAGSGTESTRKAATEAGARTVDEHVLYRRVRYSIPRRTADALCREYLGRPVTVTTGWSSRLRGALDRSRVRYVVLVGISLAILVAGLQVADTLRPPDGTGSGSSDDLEGGSTVTPVALPESPSGASRTTDRPSAVTVRPGDWPTFRGGPARVGVATRSSGPESPAEVLQYDRGVGSVSSPVVASGWLYIGGFQGTLYALDAETMSENWARSLSPWVMYSPTVANDTVFVGGQDGKLYAVDATTGDRRWERQLSNRIVRSSPVVWNDTVFISSSDGIHAVRAWSSRPLWNNTRVAASLSSPAVVDGTVFVADYRGTVYALDATTGTERWSRTLNRGTSTTPAVRNGTVYLGDESGRLYALSAETGEEQWTRRIASGIRSSAAVWNGTVFVGSSDRSVHALDATTGASVWNTTLGEVRWDRGESRPDSGVFSSPTLANGTVYVGSNDGQVYALSAVDGAVLWTAPTRGDVTASPAVVDGTVFVGSLDGGVYAIRGRNRSGSGDSERQRPA